jgi:hypothetical protein
MVNEICVSNQFTFEYTGTNYILKGEYNFFVESVFPFKASGNGSGFDIKYDIVCTNSVAAIYNPQANPFSRTKASPANVTYWVPMGALNTRSFVVGNNTQVPSAPASITTYATITASISKGGVVVDTISSPLQMIFVTTLNPIGNNYEGSGFGSVEVNDPRLNWETNMWTFSSTRSTIGATNYVTLRSLGKVGFPPAGWQARDGDISMHVANSNVMVVGELGCLFLGQPWETVRLYPHGSGGAGSMHRVLDYFTTDLPTNAVVRGKVHLGTRQRGAMVAVYDGMPIDIPGTGANRLSGALLSNVVNSVMAMTLTNASLKLSDLGTVNWAGIYPVASYPGSTDLDREAFVRNSAGLFGVRQNYFIILLYAQATKVVAGLSDRSVVAGVRAVAEVWRDPVKNAEGRNPVVVRSFKILSE